MSNDRLRGFLQRFVRGEDLTRAEAAQLLESLLEPNATEGQIAAILVALTAKGETVEELAGMASALRARAVRIAPYDGCFVDTAGTGSSAAKTFNVSTAAAFVIAGAGLPVAKHGNRAATSRSGSADVLAALGVNISMEPSVAENCLRQLGICFMFAPLYHGATSRVASVRRELGVHTAFNLLGPLSNPAGAPRQIIGVWRSNLLQIIAGALAALGTERAWVLHGRDGLDEITCADSTTIAEAQHGKVRIFELTPEEFGVQRGRLDHIRGGEAETNAQIIREVLSGTRRDEARSLVVLNAAAALLIGDVATTPIEAAQLAKASIETGEDR